MHVLSEGDWGGDGCLGRGNGGVKKGSDFGQIVKMERTLMVLK
jgi:hypothetical protein